MGDVLPVKCVLSVMMVKSYVYRGESSSRDPGLSRGVRSVARRVGVGVDGGGRREAYSGCYSGEMSWL